MAGALGRSGGARVGAGRKPKNKETSNVLNSENSTAELMDGKKRDPLEFLLIVQNNPAVDPALRVRAAIAAAQYLHTKTHDGGKKEAKDETAKKVATGRFAPKAPPSLKIVGK